MGAILRQRRTLPNFVPNQLIIRESLLRNQFKEITSSKKAAKEKEREKNIQIVNERPANDDETHKRKKNIRIAAICSRSANKREKEREKINDSS